MEPTAATLLAVEPAIEGLLTARSADPLPEATSLADPHRGGFIPLDPRRYPPVEPWREGRRVDPRRTSLEPPLPAGEDM
jgi:hypothetical protein